MTEVFKIHIRFKGKKEFTTFDNMIEFSFNPNHPFFWMKSKGDLYEDQSYLKEQHIWYPFSDIDEIKVDSNKHFDTKRELFEFKKNTNHRKYAKK